MCQKLTIRFMLEFPHTTAKLAAYTPLIKKWQRKVYGGSSVGSELVRSNNFVCFLHQLPGVYEETLNSMSVAGEGRPRNSTCNDRASRKPYGKTSSHLRGLHDTLFD